MYYSLTDVYLLRSVPSLKQFWVATPRGHHSATSRGRHSHHRPYIFKQNSIAHNYILKQKSIARIYFSRTASLVYTPAEQHRMFIYASWEWRPLGVVTYPKMNLNIL